MVALAILRVEKLKSFGNIGGSEKHTARLQQTPNADPTKQNIRLIGDGDERSLEDVVKELIQSKTKYQPRKDSVLCSEIFLSASPEYFRPDSPSKAGVWDLDRMQDFTNTARTWLEENYSDKCVRAELHLDEATPHIHAYVVPINEKTKRLSYKEMFGGSQAQGRLKLSKLQDSYAKALAPLGIQRGIKGSQATHTKVKEYYQAVNSEPLTLELNRLAPLRGETAQQLFERIQADPTIQAINHQLADRKFTLQKSLRANQNAVTAEQSRIKLEQTVAQLLEENSSLRQQIQQLRDLPLEDVAWQLGLNPDWKNFNRWKGRNHIINIHESKFYDFHPSQLHGGGGSIDLVMHVNECNFTTALAWLNQHYGSSKLERASLHWAKQQATDISTTGTTVEFTAPVKNDVQWQAVQDYLTQKRQLPVNLVQALHERGLVYADERQNAVFVMRSLLGEVNGAFLRGTKGEDNTFMGYEKGTSRSDGWFWFRMGGKKPTDEVERVVLCKSPIEAISVAVMEPSTATRTMYLAADSPQSLPREFLENIPNVELAYGNSPSDDETTRIIQEVLSHARRRKPQLADWNEELKQRQLLQQPEQHLPSQGREY
ncbi:MobV family relaxase [Nostoc parmelioides]|uniref:Plasmid recombination protein n=1 Tax=Nostoc parmelioides FACHB-3921 TaxID=2692909 RepID=A0ABR8BMF9_9NOSO|nr:MobV family relaxase [Nostoc parmelioides]MBD2254730.1 plasmid recombination protein [Nostoc parmelioides FACHB-3921]